MMEGTAGKFRTVPVAALLCPNVLRNVDCVVEIDGTNPSILDAVARRPQVIVRNVFAIATEDVIVVVDPLMVSKLESTNEFKQSLA